MNSHWLRVIGYVVLVGLALLARRREQTRASEVDGLALLARRREQTRASEVDGVWPPFWLLTAGMFAVMALGRAGDIGSLLADLGRGEAVDSGWYESRRPLQAAVVSVLGGAWLITVLIACWRTPERRRRYLPMGIMVITLAAYAGIRVVSLHHIDAVLHRRELASVRVATVIELVLLVITALVSFWVPRGRAVATDRPEPEPSLGASS